MPDLTGLIGEDRLEDLADDVWNYVFGILDAEPGVDGADAGKVAQEAKEAFLDAATDEDVVSYKGDDEDEEGDDDEGED